MKKFVFILASICLVCLITTSCSKEDDDTNSIIGTWKYRVFYLEFNKDNTWRDAQEIGGEMYWSKYGKYSFDGQYLVRDGGFKEEVIFSDNKKTIKLGGYIYEKVK